ncbi:hypothetical protein FRACA_1420004 [Frankia canadensis]|uniref:Uncharacterized protein n=1 Tax=Frankia canadensis TaxID=1836972 RepID=A0A2I2KLG6_9ACTN|nr:hypothetical protein FRACA_1420004 [Frankia canadensis]SOU53793.1 hypothetical protein FRACA_1420004 [Frankia canadensis]
MILICGTLSSKDPIWRHHSRWKIRYRDTIRTLAAVVPQRHSTLACPTALPSVGVRAEGGAFTISQTG